MNLDPRWLREAISSLQRNPTSQFSKYPTYQIPYHHRVFWKWSPNNSSLDYSKLLLKKVQAALSLSLFSAFFAPSSTSWRTRKPVLKRSDFRCVFQWMFLRDEDFTLLKDKSPPGELSAYTPSCLHSGFQGFSENSCAFIIRKVDQPFQKGLTGFMPKFFFSFFAFFLAFLDTDQTRVAEYDGDHSQNHW